MHTDTQAHTRTPAAPRLLTCTRAHAHCAQGSTGVSWKEQGVLPLHAALRDVLGANEGLGTVETRWVWLGVGHWVLGLPGQLDSPGQGHPLSGTCTAPTLPQLGGCKATGPSVHARSRTPAPSSPNPRPGARPPTCGSVKNFRNLCLWCQANMPATRKERVTTRMMTRTTSSWLPAAGGRCSLSGSAGGHVT